MWQDDVWMPTRLGEPQTQIRLARWRDGVLRPWCDGDDWFAWRLSEVAVLKRWVAAEAPPEEPALARAVESARREWPDRNDRSVLVPLNPAGDGSNAWVGRALDGNGRPTTVLYGRESGLAIRRET